MMKIDFTRLEGWKAFERLTADILEAEGFRIVRESSVDKSGVDILAEEVLASHSGAIHEVRWFVQCKHYAESNRTVGRKEIEEILFCFSARTEEGLLVVTDTEISEEASRVLAEYAKRSDNIQLVKIWNRRELENRLLRHPGLLGKYGLESQESPTIAAPFEDANLSGKKILIVSDSSPFSYQLFSALNAACDGVHLVTVWQYQDSGRIELLFGDTLGLNYDLVLFFLGDSFGFPIPRGLTQKAVETADAGSSVILFPFFAWALDQGLYRDLDVLIPVRLAQEPRRDQLWLKASRIISLGDLSPLNTESFVENQYVTVSPIGTHAVLTGLPPDFEFIHSFEFLDLKSSASCIVADTMGNPLLVQNGDYESPVLYMNSCMHNCLTRSPILSPFEHSTGYAQLVQNSILWALGLQGNA